MSSEEPVKTKRSSPSPRTGIYVATSLILLGLALVVSLRPAMTSLWVAGVIVFAVGVGYIVSASTSRIASTRIFGGREELTDEQLFEQFFAASGIPEPVFVELWHEAAQALGVRAGKMRPSDRLGQELGAYALTSDRLDALAALADARAKKHGTKLDLSGTETLGDYIRQLGGIIR